MTKRTQVVLVVERGAAEGREFEIPSNGYRAVGRLGDGDVTMQFTPDGDQPLDPEDLERVEAHLGRRGAAPEPGPGRLRIGNLRRAPDILLTDGKISRSHAMFFLDEDGPSVVDLFSTNGTRVNGEVVNDADLHDGDIVHIGGARIVVTFR